MPLTYLTMFISSLVAINYPASRGLSIFLDTSGRGREGWLSTKQLFDRTFRCEGTSWDIAGTDVSPLNQKAGISLNKTRVCCKLKNAVKLRFYSALPYCPVSKWYLRRYKFIVAYCMARGVKDELSDTSLFKMMLRFASTRHGWELVRVDQKRWRRSLIFHGQILVASSRNVTYSVGVQLNLHVRQPIQNTDQNPPS